MSNFYRQLRLARLNLKEKLDRLSKRESEVPVIALKIDILERYEISEKKFYQFLDDYKHYFPNMKILDGTIYFQGEDQ